ncbi:hypothetical protein [Agathobaculum butyriciproducens]|uniref:hypothetical protein n=1 Tax=Agathobaculum butyriciproducens TaxID=1628085 RepID=UPI0036D410E8
MSKADDTTARAERISGDGNVLRSPATAWADGRRVTIDGNFPNKTFPELCKKVFDKDNNDFFSADEILAVTGHVSVPG